MGSVVPRPPLEDVMLLVLVIFFLFFCNTQNLGAKWQPNVWLRVGRGGWRPSVLGLLVGWTMLRRSAAQRFVSRLQSASHGALVHNEKLDN